MGRHAEHLTRRLPCSHVLGSFGNKNAVTFGYAIASMQGSASKVSWDLAAARLLQEYEELLQFQTKRITLVKPIEGSSLALSAQKQYGTLQRIQGGQQFRRRDKRKCCRCGKPGYLIKDCYGNNNKPDMNGERQKELRTNSSANHAVMMMAQAASELTESFVMDSGSADHIYLLSWST